MSTSSRRLSVGVVSRRILQILGTPNSGILGILGTNSEFWNSGDGILGTPHSYSPVPARFPPRFSSRQRPTQHLPPGIPRSLRLPKAVPSARGAIRSPPPPRASASRAPCGVPHNPCHFGQRLEDNVLQHVLNRFPAPTKQLRPGITPRDQSFACVRQPPTRRKFSRSPHNERDIAFFRSLSSRSSPATICHPTRQGRRFSAGDAARGRRESGPRAPTPASRKASRCS